MFFFSIFSQIITCNKNGMLNVMTSKSISFNGLWGVSPEKAFSLFMLNINILLFIYFLCIFDFSPVFFHQGLQVNTHIWNVLKQLIFCQLQSKKKKNFTLRDQYNNGATDTPSFSLRGNLWYFLSYTFGIPPLLNQVFSFKLHAHWRWYVHNPLYWSWLQLLVDSPGSVVYITF